MKMLLKMLCVMMLCYRGVASEPGELGALADEPGLLGALAGARGGNVMSLCMGRDESGAARCVGVLWRRQWVLARASCLEYRLMFKVIVLRDWDGISCEDFDRGQELWEMRKVRVKFVHPEYRRSAGADLALVAIDRPIYNRDPLANTSTVHQQLSQFAPWMEDVYKQYPMGPRKISYAHKSSLFSTPIRMFITTIMLPSVSFTMFFLFVIFFTGPKDQIPYKNIDYEKYTESEASEKQDDLLTIPTDRGDSPLAV